MHRAVHRYRHLIGLHGNAHGAGPSLNQLPVPDHCHRSTRVVHLFLRLPAQFRHSIGRRRGALPQLGHLRPGRDGSVVARIDALLHRPKSCRHGRGIGQTWMCCQREPIHAVMTPQ